MNTNTNNCFSILKCKFCLQFDSLFNSSISSSLNSSIALPSISKPSFSNDHFLAMVMKIIMTKNVYGVLIMQSSAMSYDCNNYIYCLCNFNCWDNQSSNLENESILPIVIITTLSSAFDLVSDPRDDIISGGRTI